MSAAIVISVLLIFLSTTLIETIVLNCNTTRPTVGSSVVCTCFNENNNDVRWFNNSAPLTNCLQTISTCLPPSVNGYSFSVDSNSSGTSYFVTISSFDYSDCAEFSCQDLSVPDDAGSEYLLVTDFDLEQTRIVTEPLLHEDGDITIATECIFMSKDNIKTTWYKIENDSSVKPYPGAKEHVSIETDSSSCQTCNGTTSVKLVIKYSHKDENASFETVKLRLHIYDKANTAIGKNITTINEYRIKVSGYSDRSNGNGYSLKRILLIIFGVLGAGSLILFVGVCINDKRKEVKEFKDIDVTDSTITVTWGRSHKCCCQATYILRCSGKKEQVLRYTEDEYKFTNLTQGKTYTLEIIEKSFMRIHGKVSTLVVRTKGKPATPIDFKVGKNGIAARSITVQWEPGDNGGHPQIFILTYANAKRDYEVNDQAGNEPMKHTFKKLSERTEYKISIFARNGIGSSEVVTLCLKTHGKPAKPTAFKAAENGIAARSITVQWEPGDDGGHPQTFVLTYGEQKYEVNNQAKKKLLTHTFENLSEGTDYDFSISARNELGSSGVATLCLKTNGKPAKPSAFKAAENGIAERSITVQWEPGDDGGQPQTFVLTYGEQKYEVNNQAKKKLLTHTFENLSEGTYYDFSISARNELGSSGVNTLCLRTNGVPDPPTEFKVVRKDKTSIAVQWKQGLDGGFPQTFIITDSQNEIASASLFHYELTDLKQATYHQLRVCAVNKKGMSKQSNLVIVRTNGEPDPPMDFRVLAEHVTETSIPVRWKPGADGGFKQIFILTRTTEKETHTEKVKANNKTEVMEHDWKHLSKGTWYQLAIVSSNTEGNSPMSESLLVRTLGPPEPPESFCFKKDAVTESSIGVEWKPGFDGGFTQEFILKCFRNGGDLQKEEEPIPDAKGQTIVHTIKELSACTSYELRIFSKNIKGESKPLPPVTVRTKGLPNIN